MYDDCKVGVVVPAYNEEELIEETLKSILDADVDVDKIYVVDDKSTDKTLEKIKRFKENFDSEDKIHVILHEKNKGVGAAITSGYRKALEDEMDIAVVMAGDHQMNPEQLPRIIEPVASGRADYSKGNRLLSTEYRKGMSTWRFVGNSILTLLTKIASGYWQLMDPQNGYTAISGDMLNRVSLSDIYPGYGYCNDLLVRLNAQNAVIEDVSMPSVYGRERSGINYGTYMPKVSWLLLKDFFWRLKMKYVVFSFHPLVFFYFFGILMAPVGILLALYVFHHKFLMSPALPVSSNYPLLSAFLLIMGIQFLLFAMLFDMEAEVLSMEGKSRRNSNKTLKKYENKEKRIKD